MNRLVLFLVLFMLFLCSCDDFTNSPMSTSEGVITRVQKGRHNTYIKVEFNEAPDTTFSICHWFKGSDTCRVGQKVRLQ